MSRELFDRCGWDPTEVHARLYGYRPGGITVVTARERERAERERAELEVKAAADPPPPGKDRDAEGPSPAGDEEDDLIRREPDPAACLNDWLKDNWDTIHELAAAGQLPELARPSPECTDEGDDADPLAFDAVPLRCRIDGWTAERQSMFIQALAESACVADACRAVKMSKQSAYALRARPEAISFRNAWDAALDYATRCLADEVLSRAVKGVAVPVFYQGEQIGEKRVYDERLAMFLLQRRDPLRYGAWRDRLEWSGHPEAQAFDLLETRVAIREDADLAPEELANRFGQRLRAIAERLLRKPHPARDGAC